MPYRRDILWTVRRPADSRDRHLLGRVPARGLHDLPVLRRGRLARANVRLLLACPLLHDTRPALPALDLVPPSVRDDGLSINGPYPSLSGTVRTAVFPQRDGLRPERITGQTLGLKNCAGKAGTNLSLPAPRTARNTHLDTTI